MKSLSSTLLYMFSISTCKRSSYSSLVWQRRNSYIEMACVSCNFSSTSSKSDEQLSNCLCTLFLNSTYSLKAFSIWLSRAFWSSCEHRSCCTWVNLLLTVRFSLVSCLMISSLLLMSWQRFVFSSSIAPFSSSNFCRLTSTIYYCLCISSWLYSILVIICALWSRQNYSSSSSLIMSPEQALILATCFFSAS